MRRKQMRFPRSRDGQILVLAGASLVVFTLIAALAIDVGYVFCADARLQNAADAATLAAAQVLVEQRNSGLSEGEARQEARDEGESLVALNWDAARCEIAFGAYQDGQFVEQEDSVQATAVRVITVRDGGATGGPLAMFFAPVMGLNTLDMDAYAIAGIADGISTIRGGLGPFAVDEEVVAPTGEIMNLYPWLDLVPGNFGLLNLNGGDLGTDELQDWILNGYDGEIEIDPGLGHIIINGDTGWRSALEHSLSERLGETMLVCVYDQLSEEGANSEYRVIRFMAVELLDVVMVNIHGPHYELDHIEVRVQTLVTVPDCETDSSMDDNLVKVQLVA